MAPGSLKVKANVLPQAYKVLGDQPSHTPITCLTSFPITLLFACSNLAIPVTGPLLHYIFTCLTHLTPSLPSEKPSLTTLYKTNLTSTTSWFSFHNNTITAQHNTHLLPATPTPRIEFQQVKDFVLFTDVFLLPRTVPGTILYCFSTTWPYYHKPVLLLQLKSNKEKNFQKNVQ